MRFLFATSLLALAGCSPNADNSPAPNETPSQPAMLAGVDLGQPVRLLGTEPFWNVEMTGHEMVYAGIDEADKRSAPQPAPVIQGTVATFDSRLADGAALSIQLAATECSDGMSDRVYPLTALVQLGDQTLNGCGASAAALDRARGQETGRVE